MLGCLYCKRTKNRFTSAEHIFPQTLGNDELILPKGVVCDPCNNGPLATLDQALLHFEPVAFLRTVLGVRNKTGELPTARFANMHIDGYPDNHLKVYVKNDQGFRETPDGFQLSFQGRRYGVRYARRLARAFYKIGLGLVYLDHGLDFCHSTRYDEVREIILGKESSRGYLTFSKSARPVPKTTATYQFLQVNGLPVTIFDLDLYGIRVLFDLERRRLDDVQALLATGLFNVIEF